MQFAISRSLSHAKSAKKARVPTSAYCPHFQTTGHMMSSVRLYFPPEFTAEGRLPRHGEVGRRFDSRQTPCSIPLRIYPECFLSQLSTRLLSIRIRLQVRGYRYRYQSIRFLLYSRYYTRYDQVYKYMCLNQFDCIYYIIPTYSFIFLYKMQYCVQCTSTVYLSKYKMLFLCMMIIAMYNAQYMQYIYIYINIKCYFCLSCLLQCFTLLCK